MAASGFTPISLYYSTTPAAVPTAGNLVAGELALNTADGKLYFKNSSNVVTLLAQSGSTGVTTISFGSTGLTPSTATSGAVTVAGTLAVANGGTNATATPTAGALAYGTGSAYAFTSAGTSGQLLQSNGSSAPTWFTPTYATTGKAIAMALVFGG
jgi:hypothetical protein